VAKQKMKRKAQEEMVGFVVIMVLVAVIFLVFLGIFVRRGVAEPTSSIEVSQFLNSLSEYTTTCSLDNGFSFKKIDDLAQACDAGLQCSSGNSACQTLEETLKEIIESSWNFSPDSPEKSYAFSATFPLANIVNLPEASSTTTQCSSVRGADKSFSEGITFTLEICLN